MLWGRTAGRNFKSNGHTLRASFYHRAKISGRDFGCHETLAGLSGSEHVVKVI